MDPIVTAHALSVTALTVQCIDLARSWRRIPAIVPVHFDWKGNPGSRGTKWLLLILPIVTLTLIAGSYGELRAGRSALGSVFFTLFVCWSCVFMNAALVSVARGDSQRLPMRLFTNGLGLVLAGIATAVFVQ